MTVNEEPVQQPARGKRGRVALRIATGFAILGAVLSAGGYFWVTAVAVNNEAGYYGSQWKTYPIGPGLAAFITGVVILFGALLTIRLHFRPRIGWRLVWGSGWLALTAITLNCLGWAYSLEIFGGPAAVFMLGSWLVGFLAAVAFLIGIVVVITAGAMRGKPAKRTP